MFESPKKESGSKPQETLSAETPERRSAFAPPTLTLPKGGGAIRGIGEKFTANAVTGTGTLSVPIQTTPGRSAFSPQLALSYDSGSSNGPFGLGWNLSLPSITRKTEKGLPQYLDIDESDVFILSGSEDLVPAMVKEKGDWKRRSEESPPHAPGYKIDYYRPRIEGLFARIERWTDKSTGDAHWRSISKDNVTTLYGSRTDARIADPADSRRVFSWLISESYDDKGNAILYQYKRENDTGLKPSLPQEKNRLQRGTAFANRYLKRIKYGNDTPCLSSEDLTERTDWHFEVVFDYGEHALLPLPADTPPWLVRQDPFSSYRAGFEVRTYRLCRRVLVFHHFADALDEADYLVRSTDFHYKESPVVSVLESVEQCGYRRKPDGAYLKSSLPKLEFAYTEARVDETVRVLDAESTENLPAGLDGLNYHWVDLESEGLPGVLFEHEGAWLYKRNLSPMTSGTDENQKPGATARFAPTELVANRPSLADLNGKRQQLLLDLAGDGQNCLVELGPQLSGYYSREADGEWGGFTPFAHIPNVNWQDPNLKFVDLTGDGHSDILISEDDLFVWHPSRERDGFGPAELVRKLHDEELGPALVFADASESIYLADMSGDGLSDIVRIRNGEVCYWPNLGYGHFGAKVTMDGAPRFDYADQFEHRRIRLADIDGSGLTDIIYLGRREIRFWFNQAGNGWSSEPQVLRSFPQVNNLSSVNVVDLLSNGTACLVWSSPLPEDARRPMRYIELMGGQKPHLLVSVKNNLGAETRIGYAPSTKFYLEDRFAGKNWITRLPFPVHVVERVEIFDHINKSRFATRYAYHHGYYDGAEREFRGFGMVEQWDTEEFGILGGTGALSAGANIDQSSHVPPVLTRTWFHTGAYIQGRRISQHFIGEYYREPGLTGEQFEAMLLPPVTLPSGLSPIEEREACRAMKGLVLRREVYAQDNSEKSSHPYSVSEHNYIIELVQRRKDSRHAVFFVHPREAIDYHYERNHKDPRVGHQVTLEVDEFGNVCKSVAVGYGRRQPDASLHAKEQLKQTQTLITYTKNDFTNSVESGTAYRAPLGCETRAFEISGLSLQGRARFTFAQLEQAVEDAAEIEYEETPDGTLQRRLIEHTRTLYRKDDLTAPLPLGQLESLALPYRSYKLAFTPGLLMQIYGNRVSSAMLADEGKYVHLGSSDASWWIPSGQIFYSSNIRDDANQELQSAQQGFFLPRRYLDPFGHTTFVDYDAACLLVTETTDAMGNVVRARHDYRVMQPVLITDPNGNRSAAIFDALGLLAGTALMGKEGENLGDSLKGSNPSDDFNPDLDEAVVADYFRDPLANSQALLKRATTRIVYDLFQYKRTSTSPQPLPNVACTLTRETHASGTTNSAPDIQHSFLYSDGFGHELQKKAQAEPGPLKEGGNRVEPRWVGSGWTVYNNKGQPVKKYEPFFSDTYRFELNMSGVGSTLFYDPAGRVVATLYPNHTYEKVVFDAWQQTAWDTNDTVLLADTGDARVSRTDPGNDPHVGDFFRRLQPAEYRPTWYERRIDGSLGKEEQTAALKTSRHAETPGIAYLDTLGRVFLNVADNGTDSYRTLIELDIEGNQRALIDAKGRAAIEYEYEMLGTRIKQTSMDAGTRRMLNHAAGKPIYLWDSLQHRLHHTYDKLQRPTCLFLLKDEKATDELLVGRTVYGERHPNAADLNLRGHVYMQLDGAGVVRNVGRNPQTNRDEAYDFKGNSLRSQRQLVRDYHQQIDWSSVEPRLDISPPAQLNPAAIKQALDALVEDESFEHATTYDALNRPVTVTETDGSRINPTYNKGGLLESVHVNLGGSSSSTLYIENIDYDAKGQRQLIKYGNNVTTTYTYDPQTFRLVQLQTLDGAKRLQDLRYVYDPAGNITNIADNAQQTIYFDNQLIEASNSYTYDAIYRLIEADGREHRGQLGQPQTTWDDTPRAGLSAPFDPNAMRRYTELYSYDEVGNILSVVHQAKNGNWTRSYFYEEKSLLEPGTSTQPGQLNNRLTRTEVGNDREAYAYDPHGNMVSTGRLKVMEWNFEDQLQRVDLEGGGQAYYAYDASGQRVRKVWEKNGAQTEEHIYLGGHEIFRHRESGTLQLERQTLHVMDDKRRVALVETKTIDKGKPLNSPVSRTRYQFSNHLGSASLELNEAAQIISYEEYYPYGSTSYQAVDQNIEVSRKRYRYTSKERDEESGLYYHGARYYAPWVGRWTSPDPAGMVDGANLYAYVRDNPVRFHDETGKLAADPAKEQHDMILGRLSDFLSVAMYGWEKVIDRFGNETIEQLLKRIAEDKQLGRQLLRDYKKFGPSAVLQIKRRLHPSYLNPLSNRLRVMFGLRPSLRLQPPSALSNTLWSGGAPVEKQALQLERELVKNSQLRFKWSSAGASVAGAGITGYLQYDQSTTITPAGRWADTLSAGMAYFAISFWCPGVSALDAILNSNPLTAKYSLSTTLNDTFRWGATIYEAGALSFQAQEVKPEFLTGVANYLTKIETNQYGWFVTRSIKFYDLVGGVRTPIALGLFNAARLGKKLNILPPVNIVTPR